MSARKALSNPWDARFCALQLIAMLTVLSITIKYNEYATDKGGNFSIPCVAQGNIMWVKEHGSNSTIIQTGRVLVLRNVSSLDSGIYVCFATVPATTRKTTPITTPMPITTMTKGATIPATAATTSSQRQQPIEVDEQEHEQKLQEDLNREQEHEEKQKEESYQAFQRIRLNVRTTPGPVTQLYFKASTILGFLIWRFNKTLSGGYPVRSFTAEYRNVSYRVQSSNASYEHEWTRMDPINIAPNVRQMEVYRLAPNTTYEFRIWANNELGSGEVVTTNVTTLPETKEEDLIRLIKPDLDNFDPRIWIVAVSIVLGTLVILAIGLCIVLSMECYQSTQMELQDGWDSIELIPNIILNPGFSESDGAKSVPPFTRTVIFGHNGQEYDEDEDYEEEQEPTMEKFKRKVSVFFTGPTIKRI
ncbi:uncharacterized protein LOC117793993 [Drosophila innubila]|uniref:uncharacterized protein LOC117793993 n=1 Tax=Drosophila innubila TaxID=198719 RepID=UPI00148DB94E|nr:uncharacterized protein LOC117793993 [Drosophila innubila]